MGNTAAWTVCFWERRVIIFPLYQGWTVEVSLGPEEHEACSLRGTQMDTLTERWWPGPFLALSNIYQPFCIAWDDVKTERRLKCSSHILKTLLALTAPRTLGAPLQWQNQQPSWAVSMPISSECEDTLWTRNNGLQVIWKWRMTDVWAAVFPMFILSGRFFPPYSKCNKQKYCLKSIIEHMSSILFTNILFVLFSPPLI